MSIIRFVSFPLFFEFFVSSCILGGKHGIVFKFVVFFLKKKNFRWTIPLADRHRKTASPPDLPPLDLQKFAFFPSHTQKSMFLLLPGGLIVECGWFFARTWGFEAQRAQHALLTLLGPTLGHPLFMVGSSLSPSKNGNFARHPGIAATTLRFHVGRNCAADSL